MTEPLLSDEVQSAIDRRIAFAIRELRAASVKAAVDWPAPGPEQPKGNYLMALAMFAEAAFQRSVPSLNREQRARARVALEALNAIAALGLATEIEQVMTVEQVAALIVAGALLGRLPVEGDVLSAPKRAAGSMKGVGSKAQRDSAARNDFIQRTGKEPTWADWYNGNVVKGERGRAIAARNSGTRGRERMTRD